jgi:glycosyltransferase involved in cell wall biosynthesis
LKEAWVLPWKPAVPLAAVSLDRTGVATGPALRILHTIPGRNWGGMEQRVLEQVRWLSTNGHRAWIAAAPDSETYRRAVAQGLPAVPMAFDRPWKPAVVAGLRRFVRDNRVDVIDTHVTRDAKAAMACLDLCAVVRSRHVDQPLKPYLTRRLQWRLGCDHVVTVAGTIRRHLVETGLAVPERASWVGGWADDRFFDHPDPVGVRARLRHELALAPEATVLLCVAMLRTDKGQDHLLRAVRLLVGRGLPVVCLLAGAATAESTDYRNGLRALAAAEGIADKVRFLGYRDDVPDLMQAADMVVISSLVEGQPRVAVQAFASGRPLVATDVGGVAEIVADGTTGWLTPPADPEALAATIARALADPFRKTAVVANARRVAEETMRFDTRMEQALAVYRAALAHARSRTFPRWRGIGAS